MLLANAKENEYVKDVKALCALTGTVDIWWEMVTVPQMDDEEQ